jgi:hypothetical protein
MKYSFVGCSFTEGEGLENANDTYANLVANEFNAECINLSKRGNSNHNIFLTALYELVDNKPDMLFVQWSALNRFWIYPGPNTELALQKVITQDYSYRDIYFPKKELQKLSDNWHLLNHDYKLIIDVIMYCKLLEKVSNNTQVVFINGLLPWTEEIFSDSPIDNFEQELSKYTKSLLDFENRNDNELTMLINELRQLGKNCNNTMWVNKFNSMFNNIIDTGTDNKHPGIKSHKQYADMIINYLKG